MEPGALWSTLMRRWNDSYMPGIEGVFFSIHLPESLIFPVVSLKFNPYMIQPKVCCSVKGQNENPNAMLIMIENKTSNLERLQGHN